MLTTEPRRVCFLDEFGHMLQQINSYGSGAHAKQIVSEFTALYSAANTLYAGTAYATREPDPIDSPHLCLFGMATPEQFWRAFGSASLEDGSVARYLVMPLGVTASQDPDTRFDREAAEGVGAIVQAVGRRATGNLGNAGCLTVPMTEEADGARQALRETMAACADFADLNAVRGGGAILRRVVENALKIALVSAVGRNPGGPEIDRTDFDLGHAIARWSACTMIANIASHIADNQTERDVNDVERFIRAAGDDGRSMSEILRAHRRIKSRDLKEIVEALEREGAVASERVDPGDKGGRPGVRFFGA